MKTTLTVTLMMAVAVTASAQVVVHQAASKAASEQHLQVLLEKVSAAGIHLAVESRPVTGAPYTGEAVTESVQVLADGNRIVRRTAVRVYRDSTGRMRRETLNDDGRVTSIVISDPATGISYVVDPGSHTAHRTNVAMTFVSSGGAHVRSATGGSAATFYASPEAVTIKEGDAAKAVQMAELKARTAAGTSGMTVAGPVTWVSEGAATASSSPAEDLGQMQLEGVSAKGSRTTTVIPAGAIGNEQPITIVLEEWYSPDLKVLVMTRHADPRAGETTYRLTNISRGEPSPSLFEVPAGFAVK